MGLSPSGNHHRRRSSVLTGPGTSSHLAPTEYREEHSRATVEVVIHKREDHDEADMSDLSSIAESMELDPMSSDDDVHDDEETGLTAKQRRQQRRRRRKQRRKLDARIAGVKASRQDGLSLNLADRNVFRKLLVNASLILMWYFFSLAISIYNKWMFSEDDIVFPFPLFTTSLHMAVQFTLSSSILWLFPSLRPRNPSSTSSDSSEPGPVLTKLFYFTRLVPCGAATSLDVGLGNMSLKFISLTFLTMCKSSALAFVLLFAFVFRLETPSVKLIIIIVTMTFGVIMMVAGETAFNAVGFVLVIASAFFSGFRWGLTQILLLHHPATSNPFSTLFFLTPVMFVSLIVIALAFEGPIEIYNGFMALSNTHGGPFSVMLLIFPGMLAFCMISSEFALLKRSSVVTLSICGIFKEVVTISAAGIIFHDQLTTINIVGLVVTISSIACYNYMKISKMRSEARGGTWENSPNLDSESDESYPSHSRERGEYRRIDNPETSMPNGATPNMHGLAISTSNLNDEDRPFAGVSTMKSAPPVMVAPDSQFPPRAGRGPSPGISSHLTPHEGSPEE